MVNIAKPTEMQWIKKYWRKTNYSEAQDQTEVCLFSLPAQIKKKNA